MYCFLEKPVAGQQVRASETYYLDGTQPKADEPMKCPHCEEVLGGLYTQFVQPYEEKEVKYAQRPETRSE